MYVRDELSECLLCLALLVSGFVPLFSPLRIVPAPLYLTAAPTAVPTSVPTTAPTAPQIESYNCPSGTFVNSLIHSYDTVSLLVTWIYGFNCSDGSWVDVSKGQDIGGDWYYGESSGFCGGKVSYVYSPVGTSNALTTELTLYICISGTWHSRGSQWPEGGAYNYAFQSGKQLTGMNAATCPNGSVSNLCFLSLTFTTSVYCPSSQFITGLHIEYASAAQYVYEMRCSGTDNPISVTGFGAHILATDPTAFPTDTSGYCAYSVGVMALQPTNTASSGLQLIGCDGASSDIYGGSYKDVTTSPSCPSGEKMIGMSASTTDWTNEYGQYYPALMSHFTMICG